MSKTIKDRTGVDMITLNKTLQSIAVIKTRLYKVGFIDAKERVYYCDYLYPMTHKEACTYKTKMMNPADHFLYEVEAV